MRQGRFEKISLEERDKLSATAPGQLRRKEQTWIEINNLYMQGAQSLKV